MTTRAPSRVLIIGESDDAQVASTVEACRRRGAQCLVVSRDSRITLSFEATRNQIEIFGSNGIDNEIVCWREFPTAVWWRLKPDFFRDAEPSRTSLFVEREWVATLAALDTICAESKWINPRHAEWAINSKPRQLHVARSLGLHTPRSIVTNNSKQAQEFVRTAAGTGAIYKPLSFFSDGKGHALFTNVVNAHTICQNHSAIDEAPCIFQELVPKAHELRITVVRSTIFAVKIESQTHKETKLDWRRDPWRVPCSIETELPASFVSQLLKFHHTVGLVFGAYDFIVTPDGRYIFLEVNPAGQWGWLEQLTTDTAPITNAIADALTEIP
jgi:glutathione synthase/RimK-type ligase-like ATP-grasp enzyme